MTKQYRTVSGTQQNVAIKISPSGSDPSRFGARPWCRVGHRAAAQSDIITSVYSGSISKEDLDRCDCT